MNRIAGFGILALSFAVLSPVIITSLCISFLLMDELLGTTFSGAAAGTIFGAFWVSVASRCRRAKKNKIIRYNLAKSLLIGKRNAQKIKNKFQTEIPIYPFPSEEISRWHQISDDAVSNKLFKAIQDMIYEIRQYDLLINRLNHQMANQMGADLSILDYKRTLWRIGEIERWCGEHYQALTSNSE